MSETNLTAVTPESAGRTVEEQMLAQKAAVEIRRDEEHEQGNHTQGHYFDGAAEAWESAARLVHDAAVSDAARPDARWRSLRIDRLPQVKPGTMMRVEIGGVAIEGELESVGAGDSAFDLKVSGLAQTLDLSDPSLQLYLGARDHEMLTLDPISAAYFARTGVVPTAEMQQQLAALASAGVELEVRE